MNLKMEFFSCGTPCNGMYACGIHKCELRYFLCLFYAIVTGNILEDVLDEHFEFLLFVKS